MKSSRNWRASLLATAICVLGFVAVLPFAFDDELSNANRGYLIAVGFVMFMMAFVLSLNSLGWLHLGHKRRHVR